MQMTINFPVTLYLKAVANAPSIFSLLHYCHYYWCALRKVDSTSLSVTPTISDA